MSDGAVLPDHCNYILDFSHDCPEDYGHLLNPMRPPEYMDLSEISGTHLYCSPEAASSIRKVIHAHGVHGVHLIDTGDYHYVSKLMTDEIPEPFCLVQIDHHTDTQPGAFDAEDGSSLSCGSWVRSVLMQNPNLRLIILIGPPEESIRQAITSLNLKRTAVSGYCISPQGIPVLFLPQKTDFRLFKSGRQCDQFQTYPVTQCCTNINFPPLNPHSQTSGWDTAEHAAQEDRPDSLPIYLSIDKDVLTPEDAATDWDQGTMRLSELLSLLDDLLDARRLLGADLCGGLSIRDASPEEAELNRLCDRRIYEWLTDRMSGRMSDNNICKDIRKDSSQNQLRN